MYRVLSLVAAIAASALLASPAGASVVRFDGLGMYSATAPTIAHIAPNTAFTFSFELDDPIPVSSHPGNVLVTVAARNFTYALGGVTQAVTLQRMEFQPNGFLFLFSDQTYLSFVGPDLGSDGTLTVPSWNNYAVFSYVPAPVASRQATATVWRQVGTSSVATTVSSTGAVPEPATWGLMILGFGGMGLALRRRRGPAFA